MTGRSRPALGHLIGPRVTAVYRKGICAICGTALAPPGFSSMRARQQIAACCCRASLPLNEVTRSRAVQASVAQSMRHRRNFGKISLSTPITPVRDSRAARLYRHGPTIRAFGRITMDSHRLEALTGRRGKKLGASVAGNSLAHNKKAPAGVLRSGPSPRDSDVTRLTAVRKASSPY